MAALELILGSEESAHAKLDTESKTAEKMEKKSLLIGRISLTAYNHAFTLTTLTDTIKK